MVPLQEITSPANPRVLEARRALDHGTAMPLEGARLLAEALEAGVVPRDVFHVPDPRTAPVVARAGGAGARVTAVSERVLAKLSDLPSRRGVIALADPVRVPIDALALSRTGVAMLLDGVQDPSNVGAVLRAAEAFGAEAVLLTEGSASPFSARSLRASAGSVLRLRVAWPVPPAAALQWVRSRGAALAGASARGGVAVSAVARRRPLVLAIGSEGHGFSAALESALDVRITIPISPRVESLNAAVAAGILLHACASAEA